MKQCRKCNFVKYEDDFAFKNKSKGILQSICRQCKSEYNTLWFKDNKQKHILNVKQNKKSNSGIIKELDKAFRSLGCSVCGEKDTACLDYHHLKDKKYTVSELKSGSYGANIFIVEVTKCVVLCANCHRKLHHKALVSPLPSKQTKG